MQGTSTVAISPSEYVPKKSAETTGTWIEYLRNTAPQISLAGLLVLLVSALRQMICLGDLLTPKTPTKNRRQRLKSQVVRVYRSSYLPLSRTPGTSGKDRDPSTWTTSMKLAQSKVDVMSGGHLRVTTLRETYKEHEFPYQCAH